MGELRLRCTDARGSMLVAALVVTPLLGLLLLTRNASDLAHVLSVSTLVSYALVLGAAVFVYFHWRMASVGAGRDLLGDRHAAWLTVGLVVGAAHGLVQSAPLPDADAAGGGQDAWWTICQIVVLATMVGLTLVSDRADVPGDPALVGGVLALVVTAGYFAASAAVPLTPGPVAMSLLDTTGIVVGLVLVLVVLQRVEVRLSTRRCLAVAVVLLIAAQYVGGEPSPAPALVVGAVAANLLGAVLLGTMTQELLRSTLADHHQEMTVMRAALSDLRDGVLEDRELIHEVGSTIAGIATASRVIRQGRGVSAARRARLEEMLTAELGRLERLLSARAPLPGGAFDVVDVVDPLVVSHQTRGLDVRWTAADDATCEGNPDDLAEVVNILLENARRHGAGPVEVSVRSVDGTAVLEVSDAGPGVPVELRERIFESGERSPESPGQGLGLAIARRLVTEMGGGLELVDGPGARFVVRLEESEVARGCHVA